jgi:hypothetical protein
LPNWPCFGCDKQLKSAPPRPLFQNIKAALKQDLRDPDPRKRPMIKAWQIPNSIRQGGLTRHFSRPRSFCEH